MTIRQDVNDTIEKCHQLFKIPPPPIIAEKTQGREHSLLPAVGHTVMQSSLKACYHADNLYQHFVQAAVSDQLQCAAACRKVCKQRRLAYTNVIGHRIVHAGNFMLVILFQTS